MPELTLVFPPTGVQKMEELRLRIGAESIQDTIAAALALMEMTLDKDPEGSQNLKACIALEILMRRSQEKD